MGKTVVSAKEFTVWGEYKAPLDVITPLKNFPFLKWANTDVRRRSQGTTLDLWFHALGKKLSTEIMTGLFGAREAALKKR